MALPIMRILVDNLRLELDTELRKKGWVASTADDDYASFVMSRPNELIATLGLDLTLRDWGLSLGPSIGVRHAKVAGLVARFYGLADEADMVGASLADLFCAEGRDNGLLPRWSVFPGDNLTTVTRALVSDIELHGIPFLERFSSLRDMVSYLEGRSHRSRFDITNLLVAYGELREVEKFAYSIAQLSAIAEHEPPLVANQIASFITNLDRYYRPTESV